MATQSENQMLQQTSDDNYQLTEDGKNAQIIVCPNCRCKVLLKKTAELLTIDVRRYNSLDDTNYIA